MAEALKEAGARDHSCGSRVRALKRERERERDGLAVIQYVGAARPVRSWRTSHI